MLTEPMNPLSKIARLQGHTVLQMFLLCLTHNSFSTDKTSHAGQLDLHLWTKQKTFSHPASQVICIRLITSPQGVEGRTGLCL